VFVKDVVVDWLFLWFLILSIEIRDYNNNFRFIVIFKIQKEFIVRFKIQRKFIVRFKIQKKSKKKN
jgi:hypothetical protein